MTSLVYIVYSVLVSSALMMITCLNPIHAVISFILVYFSASTIFVLMHADFIGLIFMMVHVGAIAVLFIFVVMMPNIRKLERDNTTYLLVGGSIFVLFTPQVAYVLSHQYAVHTVYNVSFNNTLLHAGLGCNDEFTTKQLVQRIGIHLFTKYPAAPIYSGVTLLVSLIGSVHLTNSKYGYSVRRQDNQLARNNSLLNVHTY